MLRVCKLLLLMFFISPVFAMGAAVNNSALKAKEVYYDSKNDLISNLILPKFKMFVIRASILNFCNIKDSITMDIKFLTMVYSNT